MIPPSGPVCRSPQCSLGGSVSGLENDEGSPQKKWDLVAVMVVVGVVD